MEAQSKEPTSYTVGRLMFFTTFQLVNEPVRKAIFCFSQHIYLELNFASHQKPNTTLRVNHWRYCSLLLYSEFSKKKKKQKHPSAGNAAGSTETPMTKVASLVT